MMFIYSLFFNRVLFGELRLIISSGHDIYIAFRSSRNFRNMFDIVSIINYTAYVTPSDVT